VSVQASARLSPEERLRLRYEVAERYMRGDMNAEEFEHAERQYMPDYRAIMRALVLSQTFQGVSDFWSLFVRIWRAVLAAIRTAMRRFS
jgi:hypothetical protein